VTGSCTNSDLDFADHSPQALSRTILLIASSLARQFYGLRSRLDRSGGENSAALQQSLRAKSVTYVLGTICYPCLRAGQLRIGSSGRIRTYNSSVKSYLHDQSQAYSRVPISTKSGHFPGVRRAARWGGTLTKCSPEPSVLNRCPTGNPTSCL